MFPQKHRLPSQEISRVLKKGKRYNFPLFNLVIDHQHTIASTQPTTFSFVVSQRIDKRATVRNRTKRLISEAVRCFFPKLRPGFSVLVFIKKALEEEKLQGIISEVEKALIKSGLAS